MIINFEDVLERLEATDERAEKYGKSLSGRPEKIMIVLRRWHSTAYGKGVLSWQR